MNTVWLAFLTGLTTGGLSCLAVQGGLLTSAIAKKDASGVLVKSSFLSQWKPVSMFLLVKFIAYTLLGVLLGGLGATLILSPKMLGAVQIAAGLFMLATAARIAEIHPIFRYAAIEPPRWAYRLLRQTSKDGSNLAPAFLGGLTVLLPCGVTQATMAIAVASASPVLGGAIMGAFVLGTSPIFFVIGASVTELLKRKVFAYAAALVVVIFSVLSINGGIALTGSYYTLQNVWKAATISTDQLAMLAPGQIAGVNSGVQDVTINVTSRGYASSVSTLKAGVPVRLTLTTNNTAGCSRAFTIPQYNISKVLPSTGQTQIEFTPTQTGVLAYSCAMGMFTGSFNVVN